MGWDSIFDDRWLVEDVTEFIGNILRAGYAAIVAATESHRNSFHSKLKALGLDIDEAVEEGRYIALDAAEALSRFMVDGMPDRARFDEAFDDLLSSASKAAKGRAPRVGVFGECVNLLCAEGKAEAAIQMERLGNQLLTD